MRFTKMHGAGNDYIYVNCFEEPVPDDPAALARKVSDRHFGIGADGYARNYWDNVGVQYGLDAGASGQITPAEFLQLNAVIGGWKQEPDMVQEGSPFYPPGVIDPSNWDPWRARNHGRLQRRHAAARRRRGIRRRAVTYWQ